jgi:O-antigen/teichoic acid export membrane protein
VKTAERPSFVSGLARTDTGRAAGLGVAVIAANVIALGFTIVMARVLGATDYGSLAALMSAFIILMVPGSALQIAVAREVSASLAAGDGRAGTGVRRWVERLLLGAVAVAVVAVLLRGVLAAILNVDQEWAAAAVPVTAVLWMALSVERGALQGFQRYKLVALSIIGEAAARLGFALLLVGAGGDVTGAFMGTPLSFIAVGLVLAAPLSHHLPDQGGHPLRDLLTGAWYPVLALTLLFVLQEVHVIVVKHEADGDTAGAYAVAAVAAKAIVWVAVGLGLYLLPETARRAGSGVDSRPVLARTLGLIALLGTPMVLLYTAAGEPLLRAVFGDDLAAASGALPLLGLAMTLLACTYLAVQYLLGLHRASFIWALALAAAAEVVLLASIGADVERIALALLVLQLVCGAVLLTLSFRAGPGEPQHLVVPEASDLVVAPPEVAVEHTHPARASGSVRLGLGGHGAEPADHEQGA